MGEQLHTADLQQALESHVPYEFLGMPLRQRMNMEAYQQYNLQFAAMRYHSYQRLPEFVRAAVSEASYYEMMLHHLREKLQLYPYLHILKVTQYTKEPPLAYYTTMVAELLKAECSYDTLPNFTAVDVLNNIGIGRNQYLELTKEVRSKLRWHVNRKYVKSHLPQQLLSTVALPPFWRVFAVDAETGAVRRAALSIEETALYRDMLRRRPRKNSDTRFGFASSGSSNDNSSGRSNTNDDGSGSGGSSGNEIACCPYACELPYMPLLQLYRKGLVCATFIVWPDDRIIVPPLEHFVMNRTSDDPWEVLLYRVLATIDNRTNLNFLAQLLMLDEADVCAAAYVYIRLGLAQFPAARIADDLSRLGGCVHESWRDGVQEYLSAAHVASSTGSVAQPAVGAHDSESNNTSPSHCNDIGGVAGGSGGGHPARRVALLYDASLTGFLMMTNLNADVAFKQHAVTLFELGRLSDEMIGSFVEKLEQVDDHAGHDLGDEAMKYVHSVLCLREVLKALRCVVGPDKECGVDMLKVESMNELEPTTRYSVLGRNYWAYLVISPVSYAPLIDVALNGVYGTTVGLMPSPWMTLYLYAKMGVGPRSLLLPIGTRVFAWPPLLQDTEGSVAKLRLQLLTMDAEVTYVESGKSIILANEMMATAPLFVQRVADVPLEITADGLLEEALTYFSVTVIVPFTASDAEAVDLLCSAVMQHRQVTVVRLIENDGNNTDNSESLAPALFLDQFHAAVEAIQLQDSLGCFTFFVSFREVPIVVEESSGGACAVGTTTAEMPAEHKYHVSEVFIISVGLGIPLADPGCCSVMVRHLERILTEERSDRHNDAMRRFEYDFGEFLERYSPLTTVTREKMALQSTAVTGPTTQMHIRRLGEGGNGGAPFPSVMVMFDGKQLLLVDDWDPLMELWNV